MKAKFFVIMLMILFLSSISVSADTHKVKRSGKVGYLKKDRIFKDRTNIYGREGQYKGYIKRDRIFKDRFYIYDSSGDKKGYLKQDRILKDRTNIYDNDRQRKGYLKPDRPFDDRTNIFNKDGYLDEQASNRSANASNRDRKNLLAMWNYGCKFLGLSENPAAITSKRAHDRKSPYTPPTEDVLKILLVATRKEKVLLDCYLHTAARRSEIFRLTWVEDINFERRKIRLGTRKTKDGSMEYSWIPIADELYKSLWWWWNNREFKQSTYVFVDDHPGPNFGNPYKVRRRFMRSLCERAGVKPFGFHALRHFVASRLADMGKSSKTIQQLLRHKKINTTERYIQSINDGLKGVTDGLFDEKGTKKRHEKERGHN